MRGVRSGRSLVYSDLSSWLTSECTCRNSSLAKSRRAFSSTPYRRLDGDAAKRQESPDREDVARFVKGRKRRPKAHSARALEDGPEGEGPLAGTGTTKTIDMVRDGRNKTVFSLIQPTGIPHLGNYLGALRQWRDMQDIKKATRRNHTLLFGLADLHSLTLRQDRAERHMNIRQAYASLLAIGLDPRHSNLFVQSQSPFHAELMWYLSTVASTGYLSRMTQWKDKIGVQASASMESLDDKSREKLKLSLFSYPVLQAADILLYGADSVPVGEDQSQHVEFTRSLARSFNSAYAQDLTQPLLKVPEAKISPAKRIMSLQNPEKKMSKSDPDAKSRILITDGPDEIRDKIMKAKTDGLPGPITYDPEARPGVSNLIDILRHMTRSIKSPDEIAKEYAQGSLRDLKESVASEVITGLEGIRERFDELMESENKTLTDAMLSGRRVTRAIAGNTIARIRKALGLDEGPP